MKNTSALPPLDLSKSKPIETKSSRRGNISITVVNTTSNGKRIKFSKGLMEKMGSPSEIQFRIFEETIVFGSNLDDNEKNFKFSKATTGTIYNSSIVASFTDVLNLDFSSVTSITLSNIQFRRTTIGSDENIYVAVVSGDL